MHPFALRQLCSNYCNLMNKARCPVVFVELFLRNHGNNCFSSLCPSLHPLVFCAVFHPSALTLFILILCSKLGHESCALQDSLTPLAQLLYFGWPVPQV